MTSEGQHAGQQAEATSGAGGTQQPAAGPVYGAPRTVGGFPPDPDAGRSAPDSADRPASGPATAPAAAPQTAWGPDAYPDSYGPPSYPPSGGSPFVVPAVPVFGTPHRDPQLPAPSGSGDAGLPARHPDAAFRPVGRAAGPVARPLFAAPVPPEQDPTSRAGQASAVPPQAWAPTAAEASRPAGHTGHTESDPFEPHPYRPTQPPVDQVPAPPASTGTSRPYRADAGAHPYRGTGVVSGSAAVPAMAPQVPSRPGTGELPAPATADSPVQPEPVSGPRPAAGGPLPSRADRPPFGGPDGPGNPDATSGFNGFATASGPARPEQPPGEPAASRPAGISAFGGQRVRVPGAALTGLPDAPPPIQAGRPADSGGFHLRGGAEAASDGQAARQTTNGLPVRGSGTQPSFPAHGGTGFAPARGHVSGAFTPRGDDSGAPAAGAHDAEGDDPSGHDSDASAAASVQPASAHAGSAHAGSLQVASAQAVAAPGSPGFNGGPADAAAVPQPRHPADPQVGSPAPGGAAVGTARPVFASASVPAASRATRPADPQELPPPGPTRQPRVYGRSALPADPGTPNPAVPASEAPQPTSTYGPPPEELRSAQPQPDHGHDSRNANEQAFNDPATNDPATNDPATNGPATSYPATNGPAANDHDDNGRQAGHAGENRHEVSRQDVNGRDLDGQSAAAQPRFGPRGAGPGTATGRASASARVPLPADVQAFRPGSPTPFGAAPSGARPAEAIPADANPADANPGDANPGDATPADANPGDATPADANPFGARSPGPTSFGAAPADRGVMPFGEPTTDVARRGRDGASPADHAGGPVPAAGAWAKPTADGGDGSAAPYSEPTSDLAGRARSAGQPYVPAPALPSMHAAPPGVNGFPPAVPPDQHSGRRPGRPQLSGLFPPANRASVTPPGPAETSSWPAPSDNTEQSRFEAFKPEETAAAPAPEKAEPTHVRMLPVLLGVILAAALLVGVAIGVVWLIARPSDSGFNVKAGDCVRRDGETAVTAPCGQRDSFQVVSTVDTKEQCTDPGQPYVENPAGDGRMRVLCLKPSR